MDQQIKDNHPVLAHTLIIHHDFFRPHISLKDRMPAESAGITAHRKDGQNIMICNTAPNAA